jgi:hypothetical protein
MKQRTSGTLASPLQDQEAEQKNKEEVLLSIPYDCTPPDSEGHMDAVGYFCLTCNNRWAAQVADSHSPVFTQEQYLSSLCWNNTT